MTGRREGTQQMRGRNTVPVPGDVDIDSSRTSRHQHPPTTPDAERPFDIDVVLSRPWYRVGSTVVGTVRITARKESGVVGIRDLLGSAVLRGVGRCRLDPRWHNVPRSRRLLREHLPAVASDPFLSSSSDPNVFCFYATEPLDLLELRERPFGAWKDVGPNRAIRLPSLDGTEDDDDEHDDDRSEDYEEEAVEGSTNRESTAGGNDGDESSSNTATSAAASNDFHGAVITELDPNKQLLFTFRVDLNHDDMPPSMAGSTCRFSYAVVLSVTAAAPSSESANRAASWNTVVDVPLEIRTRDPDQIPAEGWKRLVISRFSSTVPSIQAMAHSSGLPCAITSLELNQWDGQVTVNRHGSAMFRNARNHLQTFRIADPSGTPVCVLTTLGLSPLSPGSRFILKFDFPIHRHNPDAVEPPWVPCHQVSACLQGEEAAVRVVERRKFYDDDDNNNSNSSPRQRARSTVFDVAHEFVDPECTERVCLHLVLPPEAPCSVDSDLVVVSTWCTIDVSVGISGPPSKSSRGGMDGGFQNLRLEIPVQVVHPVAAYERRDEEGDNPRRTTPEMDELMGYRLDEDEFDSRDAITFRRKDIAEELRILSLVLADRCGLKPKPPKPPAHLFGD